MTEEKVVSAKWPVKGQVTLNGTAPFKSYKSFIYISMHTDCKLFYRATLISVSFLTVCYYLNCKCLVRLQTDRTNLVLNLQSPASMNVSCFQKQSAFQQSGRDKLSVSLSLSFSLISDEFNYFNTPLHLRYMFFSTFDSICWKL